MSFLRAAIITLLFLIREYQFCIVPCPIICHPSEETPVSFHKLAHRPNRANPAPVRAISVFRLQQSTSIAQVKACGTQCLDIRTPSATEGKSELPLHALHVGSGFQCINSVSPGTIDAAWARIENLLDGWLFARCLGVQ